MNSLFLLVVATTLAASYWFGYTPLLVPVLYGALSLIAFLAYAKDKQAARNGFWRIPESTLHLLALFCGWPGARAAQLVFRHKTVKTSFRVTFWVTVVANAAALIWLHTRQGAVQLNTLLFALDDLIVRTVSNGDARTVLLGLLGFHT